MQQGIYRQKAKLDFLAEEDASGREVASHNAVFGSYTRRDDRAIIVCAPNTKEE